MILVSDKSAKFRETSRVKVDAHAEKRGLLLVNEVQVFADTFRDGDEVICPRFFDY